VTSSSGSSLAYTAPFPVLSQAGLQAVRQIISREEATAVQSARGSKRALRGLFYSSPFIRALQTSPRLLGLLATLAGEPLVPHACLSNSPQVNLSSPGSTSPVDHWHTDSIAYAGVVILSDMQDMQGGELELYRGHADEGRRLLRTSGGIPSEQVERVSYQAAGNMILTRGSAVLHHVTPVTSNTVRTTLILGFQPANAFQPPCTVLGPLIRVDWDTGIAPYEYYRAVAWQLATALTGLAKQTGFTRDGAALALKLRTVEAELGRVAALLEGSQTDTIPYYNENTRAEEMDYRRE